MIDNEKAINLYKKSGFLQEGIMRKSVFKKGHFIDQYIMAIVREEYEG